MKRKKGIVVFFEDDYIAEKYSKYAKHSHFIKLKIHEFRSGEIKIMIDKEEIERIKDNELIFIYNPFIEKEPEREFKLIIALNFLKENSKGITLFTPYLANSRQDKETPGYKESITLKYYIKILAECGVKRIISYDIHSRYTEKYCKDYEIEFINIKHNNIFRKELEKKDVDVVVAPDKGAEERARLLAESIGCEYIVGNKTRDYNKGIVKNIHIENAKNLLGKKVVIVDDIISSGGTIKKLLEELNINNAILAITHLTINEKGKDNLEELYRAGRVELIITTNSATNKHRINLLKGVKHKIIEPAEILKSILA